MITSIRNKVKISFWIDWNKLKKPKNFVIFPVYKKYVIPGEKSKNPKQFDKEDETQIPDSLGPIRHNLAKPT